MDLTRLSSPPRQPSRLPTARTSVSSGRNARLLSLSASHTRSRPTRPSRPLRKSRRSSRRPRLSPSSPASRRSSPRMRSSPPRPPPLPPPPPRVRLSSSIRRRPRRPSSPRRLVLLPSPPLPRVLPGSARSPLPLVPLLLVLELLLSELEPLPSEPSMAPPLELDMLPTVLWRRSMVCGSALSRF
ncbi:hypothetical protein F5H01DRAFT_334303 [Linnemannia elongata]|nr:hypothetical protein F5H01DRAFT_334303 [Linnemannia elongata]